MKRRTVIQRSRVSRAAQYFTRTIPRVLVRVRNIFVRLAVELAVEPALPPDSILVIPTSARPPAIAGD